MSVRALLVRNLSIQTVSEGVTLACGLITTVMLSHYLGTEGFGAFNYAFGFMYFFLALNDLGVNTIAVREVSRAPAQADEILSTVLSLRLVIAAVVFVLAIAAIFLWPMRPALRISVLVFACILPLNALNAPALIFQTAMRFELGALVNITNRVVGVLLIAALVAAGAGVTVMLAALLAAELAGLAAAWLLARNLVRVRWRIDAQRWKAYLRSAVPVGGTMLLVAVLNRIDALMLEQMVPLTDVGLYFAAYRVTNMLEKFPLLVMATLYPIMSRLAAGDQGGLRRLYRRTMTHFAAIGIPLGIIVALFAPWLLALAFGEPYRGAAGALRYLLVATGCLYLALSGGNLLITVGRERTNFLILAAGAVLNVALNLVLIPARGIEGAAMATAASYFVVMALTIAGVERHFARAGVHASAHA